MVADAKPYKLEVDGREISAFATVEEAQAAERLLIAAGKTDTDIISKVPVPSAFPMDSDLDWDVLRRLNEQRAPLPADDEPGEYMRHGWFRDQAGTDAEGEVQRRPAPKAKPAKKRPVKKRATRRRTQ